MTSTTVSRNVRLGRAGALLAGAAVYALLVYGPLEFLWTPFLLGVVYLVAAAAGGRRGGLWATGLVLTGWGTGVLMANKLDVGVSSADAYLIGIGAAALAAGLLARGGFAVDLIGIGGTTFIAGIFHTLAGDPIGALVKPWPYVALLAGVGVVNLALALAPRTSMVPAPKRSGARAGSTTAGASPTAS